MAKFYKDSQDRDCTYIKIASNPMDKEAQFELAKLNGYDVKWIPIGGERVRAMLIPVDDVAKEADPQAVHDSIFQADDRDQKKAKTIAAFETVSIEDAMEKAGDSSDEVTSAATGMKPEGDKYDDAEDEILKFMKEKFPDRYEQIKLQLAGFSRSDVSKMLNKGSSTTYKLGVHLTDGLYGILDSLWYLDI